MVDALVLEASTSVCGFESHLPHQKKKGTERCLFLLLPRHLAMPNAARCVGDFRFPPCVAGTCGSPHTPPPFFVIPYSLRSKRTAPATGRGLEPGCAPGFFFAPNQRSRSSRSEPSRIKEGTRKGAFFCFVPPASPRQPFPNPCRRAAHQNYSLFSILSSLVPLRPSPPTPWERQRTALSRGAEDQFPGGNAGLQNALSPRTAPHAGHRLILNPCRRAAHQNYSLFSILSSLVPLRPSPPTPWERQRTALSRGAEDQFPGGNAGLQNALSPRTAPHAGHRLILNPCRRAAHRNSSLFTLLYSLSQPCSFFPPERTAKQKYILFFHLTHNSARYNIGLNLIMEGKEYGKIGSA